MTRAQMMGVVKDRVLEWTKQNRTSLVALTSSFISVPSENIPPNGYENAFQLLFAETLEALGMDVDMFHVLDAPTIEAHPLYRPGRNYHDRPNVVGRRRGDGGGRSLMLAGHGDVVAGISGRHHPFVPKLEKGRLYGRGANDMKGGLAAAVMAVRCINELFIEIDGDVLIESVVDEEMAGSNGTLASRLQGYKPDGVILMEPSNLRVAPAHLGGRIYRVVIVGSGGMGFGGKEVVNPAFGMARLLVALEAFSETRKKRAAPNKDVDPGRGLDTVVSIAQAGSFGPGEGDGVPGDAVVEMWLEAFPGTTEECLDEEVEELVEALARDDEVLSRCEVVLTPVTRFIPGTQTPRHHPLVETAARSLESVVGSGQVEVRAAPFACDGYVFREFEIPVVMFGPTGDNAHAADEFVTVKSLEQLTAALALLIIDWCGKVDDT